MNIIEFGKENHRTIFLLHGGGLSWWNYRGVSNLLKKNYHVVIPILDGHSGSDKDFFTIKSQAKSICDYIEDKFKGKVLAMGGLSLGGQILLEMLSQNPNICESALIESTLVYPSKFMEKIIRPVFSFSYFLIKKKWFAKLQFKQLKINPELFSDYYSDTIRISKNNLISFLEANQSFKLSDSIDNFSGKTLVVIGGKESKIMKKSSELIHNKIKQSEFLEIPNYFHGDLSINHPYEYVELFERLIGK